MRRTWICDSGRVYDIYISILIQGGSTMYTYIDSARVYDVYVWISDSGRACGIDSGRAYGIIDPP